MKNAGLPRHVIDGALGRRYNAATYKFEPPPHGIDILPDSAGTRRIIEADASRLYPPPPPPPIRNVPDCPAWRGAPPGSAQEFINEPRVCSDVDKLNRQLATEPWLPDIVAAAVADPAGVVVPLNGHTRPRTRR